MGTTGWLLKDGRVLASLEIASSSRDRRRGLLGRDHFDGAMLLERTRWVHTLGMRFAIDVAFLDEHGVVVKTVTMPPHHLGAPMLRARKVLEAETGAFGRWGVSVGDTLEIRS